MKKLVFALFCLSQAVILSGISSCEPEHHEPTAEQLNIAPKLDSIYIKIIRPKCLRCHEAPTKKNHFVDLSSKDEILNSNIFPPLVVPGRPDESSLYESVVTGRMPEESSPLYQVEIQVIYDWILGLGGSKGSEPVAGCEPGEPGCEIDCEPGEPGCDKTCEPGEPGCDKACDPGEPGC